MFGLNCRTLLLVTMMFATVKAQENDVQKPEQRWIKPSPKALRVGEPCSSPDDCTIVTHSQCDSVKGICLCTKEYPVNGTHVCGQARALNESCSFSAECAYSDRNLECRDALCQCASGYLAQVYTGGNIVCTSTTKPDGVGSHVDPTMIGVLIGLILMFVIMCVVLRLFSKARWRENRTIFNTPNPRLANASLLKEVAPKQPGSRRSSLTPGRNGASGSVASIPRSIDASVSTGHSISRRPSLSRYGNAQLTATSNAAVTEEADQESDKLLTVDHHHHAHHHQISVQIDQSTV